MRSFPIYADLELTTPFRQNPTGPISKAPMEQAEGVRPTSSVLQKVMSGAFRTYWSLPKTINIVSRRSCSWWQGVIKYVQIFHRGHEGIILWIWDWRWASRLSQERRPSVESIPMPVNISTHRKKSRRKKNVICTMLKFICIGVVEEGEIQASRGGCSSLESILNWYVWEGKKPRTPPPPVYLYSSLVNELAALIPKLKLIDTPMATL